jgi:Fe-S oxidoreductase
MSIDMNVFQQFAGQMAQLGSMAQPTDYPDEERVERAKAVFRKSIGSEQAGDLEACVKCGLCAEACHFRVATGDPKYTPARKMELMRRFYQREMGPFRWLYRLATRDITAQDLEDWQELVYDSCTTCGRCGMICPMGINIAGIVTTTRQALAEAGLVPADLRAVQQEQGANGTVFGAGPETVHQAVEQMRARGHDVPLDKEKADYLVLTSVVDMMLFTDQLEATIKIFNSLGLDWTFRSDGFEGANFGLLAGVADVQKLASMKVIETAIAIGAKAVVVPECGHAYPALRWSGAEVYGKPLPFDVYVMSEFLDLQLQAGRLKLKGDNSDIKVAFHDPCKHGRYSGILDEPRSVIKALGVDFRELPSHGMMNWCCGGGAGVFVIGSAAPLRQAAFGIKYDEVNKTGADKVLMACGSCRLNYLKGAQDNNWDKEIVSLVALVGDNLE